MRFFKSREEKELDAYQQKIEMNMANNYKDAAQMNLSEWENRFEEIKQAGTLKSEIVQAYESMIHSYKIKLKGYTHKDQKPYWT